MVNGSLWTISYEFACYLGVALLGVAGVLRRRRVFLGSTVAVAGVWLLPTAAPALLAFSLRHFGRAWTDGLYRVLVACHAHQIFLHLLLFFCAGGCFALFRDRVRLSGRWAVLAAAALVSCLWSLVPSQLALMTVGAYAFFTFAFARIPALAWFRGHTDISYGVYLYGWPVQQLITGPFPDNHPGRSSRCQPWSAGGPVGRAGGSWSVPSYGSRAAPSGGPQPPPPGVSIRSTSPGLTWIVPAGGRSVKSFFPAAA